MSEVWQCVDVWDVILGFLSLHDRVMCRAVCILFRDVVDEMFRCEKDISRTLNGFVDLNFLAQRCTSLVTFDIKHTIHPRASSIITLVSNCPSLASLSLNGTRLHDGLMCAFQASPHPSLHTLNLESTHLSADAVAKIIQCLPSLETLVLACLQITDDTLTHVAHRPVLTSLDISDCALITSAGLHTLGTSDLKLSVLKADRCPQLCNQSLTYLAPLIPHLTHLQVSSWQLHDLALPPDLAVEWPLLSHFVAGECELADHGIASLTTSMTHLQTLTIPNTSVGDDGVAAILRNLGNLMELDLTFCQRITRLHSHLPLHLKRLRMGMCTNVAEDCLIRFLSQCPDLEQLSVAWCGQITDATLLTISQHLPKLTKLDAEWCEDITDAGVSAIAAACTELEELSFEGCCELTDGALDAIARQLSHLRVLNVSGCDALTDTFLEHLIVHSMRLDTLNVRYCRLSQAKLSLYLEFNSKCVLSDK